MNRRLAVLLVHRDPSACEPLAWTLRNHGYRVWTAYDGREALLLMERFGVAPDLVIVDLQRPSDDASRFLRAICADPRHGQAPVVVMTDDRAAVPDPCPPLWAVLTRPVEVEQLVAVMADLLTPRLRGNQIG